MAPKIIIHANILLRTGTTEEWETKNTILREDEAGFEFGVGNFKFGDGVTRWNDLDYFLSLGESYPGDDTAAMAALNAHIASILPHPVYDDGGSFELLYQNAKV